MKGGDSRRRGPKPKPRPSSVTESDLSTIKAARSLREKLQQLYNTPCAHCGAMPTIPRLAAQIGVDSAVLWRFVSGKQETLMEENFEKLQRWVESESE